MKKLILASVISVAASGAFAGSYSEPVVEPVVIIEDTASSSSHAWVAPALLILIAIALSI